MDSVQKDSCAYSCPTPMDSEIDWLLDQLSQGLDNNNALTYIGRLLEKLDAKTRSQADQCAEMKASRCNTTANSDAVSPHVNRPFVAFSPAGQAFQATSEPFQPVNSVSSTSTSTHCDEVSLECELPPTPRSPASYSSSFRRFLEDSDSESDSPRTRFAGKLAGVAVSEIKRPAAESPRPSDISDISEFSDALSSMSNAPSEMMSEIPEEIMEVESVVSADFNALSGTRGVVRSSPCMSEAPSEISEDIQLDESDTEEATACDKEAFENSVALSMDDGRQRVGEAHDLAGVFDTKLLSDGGVDATLDVVEILLRRLHSFESRCSGLEQQCAQSCEENRFACRRFTYCLETLEQQCAYSREELAKTKGELSETQDELLRTRLGLSKVQMELARTQAQLSELQNIVAFGKVSHTQSPESPGEKNLYSKEADEDVEVQELVHERCQVAHTIAKVGIEAFDENVKVIEKTHSAIEPREAVKEKASKASIANVDDQIAHNRVERSEVEIGEAIVEQRALKADLVLKISHKGCFFRVRAPSSELESVKKLVADTVGRDQTSCEVVSISGEGEHRLLSVDVWQNTLMIAESHGQSNDSPFVVRLDVQDATEAIATESVVSIEQSVLTETALLDQSVHTPDDGIDQHFEFASHQEIPDSAGYENENHSVTSAAQRLASRLSVGLWSVASIFRAR